MNIARLIKSILDAIYYKKCKILNKYCNYGKKWSEIKFLLYF